MQSALLFVRGEKIGAQLLLMTRSAERECVTKIAERLMLGEGLSTDIKCLQLAKPEHSVARWLTINHAGLTTKLC